MRGVYRREPSDPRTDAIAAGVAAAAGAIVFYFARLWLQRERIPPLPSGEENVRASAAREGGARAARTREAAAWEEREDASGR